MRVVSHFALWSVGAASAESSTSRAEREMLSRYAAGRRRVVEIGVWHGVNTRRLREAMDSQGVLCAVDPFPRGRLGVSFQRFIAHREVGRVPRGTVRWMEITGEDAARRFVQEGLGQADFIFVDGDHSWEGVRRDWEAWSPVVAPRGIVALHDSRATDQYPIGDAGSVRFTQEVVARDPRFSLVDAVDRLSIFVRKDGA